MQPRKVRIVADEVKGKRAVHAAHLLRFHSSKGARELRKALISAIANAENNLGIDPGNLIIRIIQVDEGPKLKRITQKAMGRGARIEKKTSHITVVVEDAGRELAVKPHGTKAKPRRTLAVAAPKVAAKGKAKAAKEVDEKKPTEEAVEASAVAEPVVEATAEAPAEETPVAEAASEAPATEEGAE